MKRLRCIFGVHDFGSTGKYEVRREDAPYGFFYEAIYYVQTCRKCDVIFEHVESITGRGRRDLHEYCKELNTGNTKLGRALK